MLRYNHSLVERKWIEFVKQGQQAGEELPRAYTVLVPGDGDGVDLENARLLVLTDFFAALAWGRGFVHCFAGSGDRLVSVMARLGVAAEPGQMGGSCHLAVVPRDFPHLGRHLDCGQVIFSGRHLGGMALGPLLADVGGDALRIYFLFQGPPERDYAFNWHGLVSAHRFVQRVWRLAQNLHGGRVNPVEESRLQDLAAEVQKRALQRKPHTALAAIMGYLKVKIALSPDEVRALARLLEPFAPFLSVELADLLASIENDDDGQGYQADG